MARKSMWELLDMPDKLDAIRGWAMQGYTEKEMMQWLNVSHQTFYEWKRNKSDFAEALKKGRQVATGEVLNSLHTQTQGYWITEMKPHKVKKQVPIFNENTGDFLTMAENEEIEMVPMKRWVEPTGAVSIFMGKNRAGLKDRQEIAMDPNADLANMSDEEIKQQIGALEQIGHDAPADAPAIPNADEDDDLE